MIQISETATILLMLGFAMFLGLILTRAVRNFGIPAVTAYLVAGLLIGPSLIGRLGIGFRTFEDVEGAAAWRAYTSQGNRGFEGLGLGSYRDREIRVLVSLPPEGGELFLRVEMDEKEETPFVESGSLCLPLAADAPRYLFNKNGDLIDPARDIVAGANHALYCLEAFACAESEGAGVCVVSRDATSLRDRRDRDLPLPAESTSQERRVLYFNLFNNMWGTNFPQWIGGELAVGLHPVRL